MQTPSQIDIDLLQKAWDLASHQHKDQYYTGPEEGQQIPYLTHIGAVVFEVQQAVNKRSKLNAQLALLCAILHDTLEDTDLSPATIEKEFGASVLAGVKALTKNTTLPDKRAQMLDSLERILQQPAEVALVKMADRICNLQPPPYYWQQEKKLAYQQEARLILEKLGGADAYLAERLSGKIEGYERSLFKDIREV